MKATTQNAKLVEHRSTTVKKKELKFGGNARNAVTLKVKAIGDVALKLKPFPKVKKLRFSEATGRADYCPSHEAMYVFRDEVQVWRGNTAQKLREIKENPNIYCNNCLDRSAEILLKALLEALE